MAANGLSAPPSGSSSGSSIETYSKTNAPPHWTKVKKIMSKPYGGSVKGLKEFLKGGWRDVNEDSEKWWVEALGGKEVEEVRKARLEVFGMFKSGMEGARLVSSG